MLAGLVPSRVRARTPYRRGSVSEFHQYPVAGRLDDAAGMLADLRVDELAAMPTIDRRGAAAGWEIAGAVGALGAGRSATASGRNA
jgi:hypothetical protein